MNKSPGLSFLALFLALLLLFPQPGRAEEIKLQVLAVKADLRARADIFSTIVTQVSAGTILMSDRKEGGWYRIILPPDEDGVQKIAFIQESLVEVLALPEEHIQKPEPLKEKEPVAHSDMDSQKTSTRTQKQRSMEFGLRLFGGYSLLSGPSTMNDASDGITKQISELVILYNASSSGLMTLTGRLHPLKSAPIFGGELFFNINPYLGFALGGGYLFGSKENTLEMRELALGISVDNTYAQKVSVPFIQMTIAGGVPVGELLRIIPYIGGGLYLGDIVIEHYMRSSQSGTGLIFSAEELWTAQKRALGLHGGLNIEVYFTRNVGLFFGAGGILATFKEIVGDMEWSNYSLLIGSSSGTEADQKLWSGEIDYSYIMLDTYSTFWLDDQKPADPSYRNVEPGVISISQFRFIGGIMIFFGR